MPACMQTKAAATREERTLTVQHPIVLMAHCLWCGSSAINEASSCFSHILSNLNSSGPVSQLSHPSSKSTQQSQLQQSNLSHPDDGVKVTAAVGVAVALHCLLIAVGLVSNLLVSGILIRRRQFANVTNLFVLGLSLSDILICGLLMPSLMYYDLSRRGYISASPPGRLYCQLLLTSLNVPIYASCLIILWIAVDRHRLICQPHRRRMSRPVAVGLLLLTGLVSALVHSPTVAFNAPPDGRRSQFCAEQWPDKRLRLAYSIGAFCLQFCTPLLVTGALYSRIYRRLQVRAANRQRRETRRKRRTNRILVAIVISFAIFWSPWSVFNVVSEIEQFKRRADPVEVAAFLDCVNMTQPWDTVNENLRTLFDSYTDSIVQGSWNLLELYVRLFALGSACVNPYLYGWLNEQVRSGLTACLPCCAGPRGFDAEGSGSRYRGESRSDFRSTRRGFLASSCRSATRQMSLQPMRPASSAAGSVVGGNGHRGSLNTDCSRAVGKRKNRQPVSVVMETAA
ncbi:hypothetical protein BOX15_Mlig030024g1 [Macrostomum lignano]|uniref:G-protein coupled receptors family 1 profile domain-containing protein n=1 Tax=Macrostomum lignano TaxID=282301 RepID=A0A267ET26_9PLAT|nr:hypothetical protein BOX15_Mlig030024g1 [Macrostomum lignano]